MVNDELTLSEMFLGGRLSDEEQESIKNLAAAGCMPAEIAMGMDWPDNRRIGFCSLAKIPGSFISKLIASGRGIGRAIPYEKLSASAMSGDIDAINALHKLQENNRFRELLYNMDEDELTD